MEGGWEGDWGEGREGVKEGWEEERKMEGRKEVGRRSRWGGGGGGRRRRREEEWKEGHVSFIAMHML